MRAAIISIGDELVLGQVVDTNSAWLSGQLAAMGIEVAEHVTVGDDALSLAGQLRRTSQQVEVIIAGGGLGPTDDDLTRHILADILGVELQLHEPSLQQTEDFFARLGKEMTGRNRVQAMIPQGCEAIVNPVGTAPGIAAKLGGAAVFFLPGVPRELKRMFSESVRDQLSKLVAEHGQGLVLVCRVLHTFGQGESNLAELIGDMMTRGNNPVVNMTAAGGMVSIRINARAATATEARQLIGPVEDELRRRLGTVVFGSDDETLAGTVGRLLRERGMTLAVAESCTAGLLAGELTRLAGASDYFRCGWVVYSNQAKGELLGIDPAIIERYGAVSREVAEQLADKARLRSGSDIALGITGIAGPTGGSSDKPVGLVYIALSDDRGVRVERCVFLDERTIVRQRAVNTALNLLRQELVGEQGG